MRGVLPSILLAFTGLFHPRMLWLMLWPVLAAALLWCTALILFWTELVAAFSGVLGKWIAAATFFVRWDPSSVAQFAATALILILVIPLIQFTALLVIGFAGMPAAVVHVCARRFPDLQRKRGGSLAGSLGNAAVALLGMALLFTLTLPLWVLPPLWPVLPVAVLAWANQRMLRYDALAEHASRDEMRELFRTRALPLYALGVFLAVLAFVPLVGFFAPALFSLAFANYLLAELSALRAAPIEAEAVRV